MKERPLHADGGVFPEWMALLAVSPEVRNDNHVQRLLFGVSLHDVNRPLFPLTQQLLNLRQQIG
jgi:hypothetical protein